MKQRKLKQLSGGGTKHVNEQYKNRILMKLSLTARLLFFHHLVRPIISDQID